MAVRNFSRPWSRRLQNRRTRSIYGPSFKVLPVGGVINDTSRALGIEGDGLSSNRQIGVPTGSYVQVAFGGTGTVREAQSFVAESTVLLDSRIMPWVVLGTPTDGLTIELQSDSSGHPSGTVLASTTVAQSSISTTIDPANFQNDWLSTNLRYSGLIVGQVYWIVVRRAGAPDSSNYNALLAEAASGTGKSFFGSSWVIPSYNLALNPQTGDSSYGFWRGATNLIENSSFEDGTLTAWSQILGSWSVTSSQSKFGTYCATVTAATGTFSSIESGTGTSDYAAVSVGSVYLMSAWVRTASASDTVSLDAGYYDAAAAFVSSDNGPTSTPTPNVWTRITRAITVPTGVSFTGTRVVFHNVSGSTQTYYVDGAQFELVSNPNVGYPTPHIYTTTAPASRVASYVTAPSRLINASNGWFAIRHRLGADPTYIYSRSLFGLYRDINNFIRGYIFNGNVNIDAALNGVSAFANNIAISAVKGDVITVIYQWTFPGSKSFSVNGSAFSPSSFIQTPTGAFNFYIGYDPVTGQPADGEVLWAACGTGTLSDADAVTIHGFGDAGSAINYPLLSGATFYWPADTDVFVIPTLTVGTPYTETGTINLKFSPNTAVEITAAVESNTARLSFTVSAAETREETDAATVPLLFTASAAEAQARETSDSGTTSLVLTASAAEIREISDSNTVPLLLVASTIEVAEFADANTATIVFTPSVAETREEVDSATVALLLTPNTAAETAQDVDSNTASVVFTVSSTAEVAAFIDSATTSIALTPSTAELAQFTDSSTATVTFTPSTAELREVTDSNTALVSFTPSAAETRGVTDSNTSTITFTPSSSDVVVLVDSNTGIVTFTPSSTVETIQDVDAATGVVTFTPSSSDVGVFTDTNTASVLFSPSSAELRERTDSATSTLALTPSSTVETAQYVDSNTGVVTLTPSTVEIAQEVDAATGIVTFTPSSADTFVGTDATTKTLVLTVSSTETYIPAFAGTDAATAILALTPSTAVETLQDVDAKTVTLGLVPSTAEFASFVDATTGVLVFTVSSADVLVATDAATSVVNLVPSSADVQAFVEANTVPVQLVPSSSETAALTDSATTNLLFTVSALESVIRIFADANTVQLNLLASSADVGTFVEASAVYLLLGPHSTDDVLASIDALTVTLNLSVSGTDLPARTTTDQATALLLLTPSSAVELIEHTDANTALLLFTPSAFISIGAEDEATVNLVFTPIFVTSVQDVGTALLLFSVSGTEVGVIVKTLLSAIFIGQKWSIRSRGTRTTCAVVETTKDVISRGTRTSCAGLDARYAAINRG